MECINHGHTALKLGQTLAVLWPKVAMLVQISGAAGKMWFGKVNDKSSGQLLWMRPWARHWANILVKELSAQGYKAALLRCVSCCLNIKQGKELSFFVSTFPRWIGIKGIKHVLGTMVPGKQRQFEQSTKGVTEVDKRYFLSTFIWQPTTTGQRSDKIAQTYKTRGED